MKKSSKQLTVVALLILILGLGIGFATFSTTLSISAGFTVRPYSNDFKVIFTKYDGSSCTSEPIKTLEGYSPNSKDATIVLQEASIVNGTVIKNIGAQFNAPNQSASYKVCVYNAGTYNAYLSSVNIGDKDCIGSAPNTITIDNSNCQFSKLSIKLGNDTFYNSEKGTSVLSKHTLSPKASEIVEIKLEYGADAPVNADLNVSFNVTSLVYDSTDTSETSIIPGDTSDATT